MPHPLLRLLAVATALASALTLADLRGRTLGILLWAPKLLAGALAPLLALAGVGLAASGLRRRDPLVAGAGLVGAALASRYTAGVTAAPPGFAETFGPDWPARLAGAQQRAMLPHRWNGYVASQPLTPQVDLPYGVHPETGKLLLADLWLPPAGVSRSGLAVIYVHGGAWRMGEKDMGTGWMFGRLVSQGHVVLDIDYTLAPSSDVPGMVQDVKRAIIWLKRNGPEQGVDPRRIVLMGGSAGGHLALLAAYTPNDPALQPDASTVDTTVAGVISFYGPADFREMYEKTEEMRGRLARRRQRIRPYGALLESMVQWAGLSPAGDTGGAAPNYIADLLGADPDREPELYSRLSPLGRVGLHCPPTLLLQGTADIFGMGPSVRRLHQALTAAGAPSVLVEFPGADHGFDLALPQLSPAAQAAVYDVERFLALL